MIEIGWTQDVLCDMIWYHRHPNNSNKQNKDIVARIDISYRRHTMETYVHSQFNW